MVYTTTESLKDAKKVEGLSITDGVVIIEPDLFGAGGKVVGQITSEKIDEKLSAALTQTLRTHVRAEKSRRELAQRGLEEGIFYETNIPVSGQGEANDRERYKKQLGLKKKKQLYLIDGI